MHASILFFCFFSFPLEKNEGKHTIMTAYSGYARPNLPVCSVAMPAAIRQRRSGYRQIRNGNTVEI